MRQSFSLLNLRARLILLVLLAVIPAFGVILYTADQERNRAQADAAENTLRLTRAIDRDLSYRIGSARQLLIALAQIPQVRSGDAPACSALLADLLKQYPEYTNLGVVESGGNVSCSALPFTEPVTVSDRVWFRRALETRDFAIGEYQIGRITGKAVLVFGYPLLDAAGQVPAPASNGRRNAVQGVIFAALDLAWLNQLAASIVLPPDSVLTVLDRTGTILARSPNPEQWVGQVVPDAPLVKIVQGQKSEGTVQVPGGDGVLRLYAFSPLAVPQATTDAYVSIGIPTRVAFAEIEKSLRGNLSALGIVAALALTAAWFGGDLFILRRVNALVRAAKQLASGDLGARTGLPYGVGELSHLARTFDQMAESLQQRETERKRAEQEIERRANEFISLYKITCDLAAQRDLSALLQAIVERATELLTAPSGAIYLYDAARGDLEVAVAKGPELPLGSRLDLGEGMSGIVTQTHAPLIVDEYHTWEQRSLKYEAIPYSAVIEVPMLYGGELIGILSVGELAPTTRKFTAVDACLLSLFAAQAAGAVQNARLFEETRKRAEQLAILNRIAGAVSRTLDLDELMEIVYREISATLTADAFFLALYDAATDELDFRIRIAEGHRELPERRPLRIPTLTSQVVNTKKPLLIRDWEQESERYPPPKLYGTMKAPRAWLGVPIQIDAAVVGVIGVQAYHPNAYGEEEERLLATIADQVAVAIEKARLFEQAQRRALEQGIVGEIALALNTTLDARQAFPTIARELRGLTNCERVSLALLDETGKQFIMVALDQPRPELVASPSASLRTDPAEPLSQGTRLPLFATSAAADILAGKPHLTADLATELVYPVEWALYEAGFRSRVNLPLVVGERVIGALNLASCRTGTFTLSQIPALQQVAAAVAISIEHTRLFEAEQTRRAELATLYDLSRALADAKDCDTILELVTRRAVEAIRITFARIVLCEGDALVVRAAYPTRVLDRDLEVGHREPIVAHPYCQRILEQGAPVSVRAGSPELGDNEREFLFLGFAQTLCLVPLRVSERSLGLLMLGEARREEREPFTPEKIRLAHSIGDQTASALHRTRLREQTERDAIALALAYDATIEGWSSALDLRDKETEGHTQRVTEMTERLARAMGLRDAELMHVRRGALLHDIGKLGVPDGILLKPGTLTDEEWKTMREHPEYAYNLLSPIAYLHPALDIPYCHHEKWDGTGYPRGLKGEQIPLAARIFAVVDVWDALRSDRPYRAAWPEEKVREHICSQAGRHFDPKVVEAFLEMTGR